MYLHYSITGLLATELPSGIHIYRFYIKLSSGPVSQGWWAWVPSLIDPRVSGPNMKQR